MAPKAVALYGVGKDREEGRDPRYGSVKEQWGTVTSFRCPGVLGAKWHSAAENAVCCYEFGRAIPPRASTGHSTDLPYVFGNLLREGSQAGEFTEGDRKLSDAVQIYWTNFAKKGDPNGEGVPAWPKFGASKPQHLEFTNANEVKAAGDDRTAFCDLFSDVVKNDGKVVGVGITSAAPRAELSWLVLHYLK